jgi:hypothetical protein
MCSICGSLLLNAKSIVQCFFYFSLKRKKNKYNKGKAKRKWHRKILLQIQFFAKLFTNAKVGYIVFFRVCAIFTNTKVGNIRRKCSLTPESGT